MLKFPDGFWWGGATSGPQMEGYGNKQNDNIMDLWYRELPTDFFNQIGPGITTDFYNRYKNDLQLLKQLNFNSFRTSIQWTRLIDDIYKGSIDKSGVDYYRNLFMEMKNNGIRPVVNLFHFDMPAILQTNENGWVSRKTVDLFVDYAKQAFDLFGDIVLDWTIFNEPMVIPEAGYFYGLHYPKYKGHSKEGIQVMYHLALATAKTIDVFKSSKAYENGGRIGTILNITPCYPATENTDDLEASIFADDFFNNFFLQTAVEGTIPESLALTLKKDGVIWNSEKEDTITFKNNTVDFLGLNYYHPRRVQGRKNTWDNNEWMPDKYFENFDMPNKRVNPYRGWEIYPQALYDIAIKMRDLYPDMPWFVSENGMGVENELRFINDQNIIEDDYRIEFYEEHLYYLYKAIQEGSNCFGFHVWTALDCWSWNNAYKNRYGLIQVDLDTQKRTFKKSGLWFKELSYNNGFLYDDNKS